MMEAVRDAIEAVQTATNRLVLLVGPPGSGKSRELNAVHQEVGYPLVHINAVLAEGLKPIQERRRPTHVRTIVADQVGSTNGSVVLIDNIELLFLPELEQDPLQLLKDLARNRVLCVAWPGRLEANESLAYAEVGHPEYRRYPEHRTLCVKMPGTL